MSKIRKNTQQFTMSLPKVVYDQLMGIAKSKNEFEVTIQDVAKAAINMYLSTHGEQK